MIKISKRGIDISIMISIHIIIFFEVLNNAQSASSVLLFYWLETAIIVSYCVIRVLTGITPTLDLADAIALLIGSIPVCGMMVAFHFANLATLEAVFDVDISFLNQGAHFGEKLQFLIVDNGLVIPVALLVGTLLVEWFQTWNTFDYALKRKRYTGRDWFFEPILRITLTFVILVVSSVALGLPMLAFGLTEYWASIFVIVVVATIKIFIEVKWSGTKPRNIFKTKKLKD